MSTSSEQIMNETTEQAEAEAQEAKQEEESTYKKLLSMTKSLATKAKEKTSSAASSVANSKVGKLTGNAAAHAKDAAKGASQDELRKHAIAIHDMFDHLRDVTRAAAEPGGMNGMCGDKKMYEEQLKKTLPNWSHDQILSYIEEHCSNPENAKITKKQKAVIMSGLYMAQKTLYGSYLAMGKVSAGISGMKKGISSAGKSLKAKFNSLRKKKPASEEIEMTGGIKSKENTMKGGFFKLPKLPEAANAQLQKAHSTLTNMAAPHIKAAKESKTGKTAAAAVGLGATVAALGAGAAYLGANVASGVAQHVAAPHIEAAKQSKMGKQAVAAAGVAANHAKAGLDHATGLYNTHKNLKGMNNVEIEQHVNNSQNAFDSLITAIRQDMTQGSISQAEGNSLISSITAIHDAHMKIAKSKITKQKTAGGRKTKRHNKKKRARTRKAHKRRSRKHRKPKRKPSRRVNKKHKSRRNKKHTRRHRMRRGGGRMPVLLPQSLVNFGRGIESGVKGIADSWNGKPMEASPYPTQDQYVGQNVKIMPSKPVNVKSIYAAAGKAAGSI